MESSGTARVDEAPAGSGRAEGEKEGEVEGGAGAGRDSQEDGGWTLIGSVCGESSSVVRERGGEGGAGLTVTIKCPLPPSFTCCAVSGCGVGSG